MRPEDIFENIKNLMIFGSSIDSIAVVGANSTITTDNIYTLVDGMLVEIGNNVYQVSNVTIVSYGVYTFDVVSTSITAGTWQLALYYEFGRALEVGNTLDDQKGDPTNKNKRFPLMWLLTDIDKVESDSRAYDYEADIVIGFIYLSQQNLKAEKRIDTNFEPILDPLVTLFKTAIKNSGYFLLPFGENYNITETDKFKYGSVDNNRNVFADITDAIELNMTLKFNKSENLCIN